MRETGRLALKPISAPLTMEDVIHWPPVRPLQVHMHANTNPLLYCGYPLQQRMTSSIYVITGAIKRVLNFVAMSPPDINDIIAISVRFYFFLCVNILSYSFIWVNGF